MPVGVGVDLAAAEAGEVQVEAEAVAGRVRRQCPDTRAEAASDWRGPFTCAAPLNLPTPGWSGLMPDSCSITGPR